MEKIILLSVLILAGCGTTIKYVEVPPKEPPFIARPALDTDFLKPGDDAGVVLQAHRLTIKRLQQWGLELETALNAYRKDKPNE